MVPQLQRSLAILLALLLALTPLTASVPTASSRAQTAQETMPDGLMSAVLAASAHPSEADIDQKVTASDGATSDLFGYSVALSDDTALVGAYADDVGANAGQGSAYVFTRSGTIWTQQTKLTASDGASGNMFGSSVALSGDTALVGAYNDDVGANTNQGSAYFYQPNFPFKVFLPLVLR